MKTPPPSVIFFGTPDFVIPVVEALRKHTTLQAVVVPPDRKSGRKRLFQPPPVKHYAQKFQIPVIQEENHHQILNHIRHFSPDVGVLFSYGFRIPQSIIESFPYGIIVIHPSLLPQYRGPSPVQTAILNGDKQTGVTLIQMDEKIDHGPIIAQQAIKLFEHETARDLLFRLATISRDLLIRVLPEYLSGKIVPQPQDDHLATYTKKITKEDGHIQWKRSAEEIYRQYRALMPWPGIFTFWNGKRIKILKVEKSIPMKSTLPAGKVFLTNTGKLAVMCKDAPLIILEIQKEGRKPQSSESFLHGNKTIIGARLN